MKKRGISIILGITTFAVIFYGYRYLKIPVETQTAKLTRLEEVTSHEAYVVREEAVYQTETDGTLYGYVQEGARVAKNMKIATVYQGNSNGELIAELNNIDKKIEQLKSEKQKHEIFKTDYSSRENSIDNIKYNIIDSTIKNDISKISEYKRNINSLFNNSEFGDDTLNELLERKKNLESQLSSDKHDIFSTISGVYSENVDALEWILTPEAILEYKVLDFDSIGNIMQNQKTTKKVKSGEYICKVVDNHVWYAITKMPKKEAEKLKSAKNLFVRFDSLVGSEVVVNIEYISNEEDTSDEVVVVLKSDRYLEGVYGIRHDNIEIVQNQYVGFSIPSYSLRNIDDKTGVLISKGTSEIFCECDIIYIDEKSSTVIVYPTQDAKRKLTEGDKIILGEKTQISD